MYDNSKEIELTSSIAHSMLDTSTSLSESVEYDDPLVSINYNQLLRRVMQQSDTPWKIQNFLELCKTNIDGFDYRVEKDKDGRPDYFTWCIERVRKDLI